MPAPKYQQVQGPNFSGSAAASASAARSISSGIATLSSGLTKLGDRRAKRIDETNKLKQAQALEALKLQAFGADEAGLQAIAAQSTQSGSAVPGLAEYLGTRQGELLKNAGTAATTAGTLATTEGTKAETAGTVIDNNQAQFDLDADRDNKALQQKISQLGFAAEAMAADGNIQGANEYRNEAIRLAGGAYGEGATNVSAMIENVLSKGASGQENRTAVANDETLIAQNKENLYNSRGVNTDANRRRDFEFGVDVRDDKRAQQDLAQSDVQDQLAAKFISENVTPEGAFSQMAQNPNIDPETRVAVSKQIGDFLASNEGIQGNINPADPFATKYGDAQNNTLFGIPESEGSAQDQVEKIAGATGRIQASDRQFAQYKEAQELQANATDTGGRIDVRKSIQEAVPGVRFTEGQERKLRNFAQSFGATDAQLMSAISEETRRAGFWESIGPGGKKWDKSFVDTDAVRRNLQQQVEYADSDKRRDAARVEKFSEEAQVANDRINTLSQEVSQLEQLQRRNPEDPRIAGQLQEKARMLSIQRLLLNEISDKATAQELSLSNPTIDTFYGTSRRNPD